MKGEFITVSNKVIAQVVTFYENMPTDPYSNLGNIYIDFMISVLLDSPN